MKSLRPTLFLLLLFATPRIASALTIVYPVDAIADLWLLNEEKFKSKYGGINVNPGLGPGDEGWYVRYKHENLTYFFGPITDFEEARKKMWDMQAVRDEAGEAAVWLDEQSGPLEPRNIYGVTKLAAEGLCRVQQLECGIGCTILRTARFFPEDDDSDASQHCCHKREEERKEAKHVRLPLMDESLAKLRAIQRDTDQAFPQKREGSAVIS